MQMLGTLFLGGMTGLEAIVLCTKRRVYRDLVERTASGWGMEFEIIGRVAIELQLLKYWLALAGSQRTCMQHAAYVLPYLFESRIMNHEWSKT